MTNVYLSAAVAGHADKIQADHARDQEGWCGFCLRHFHVRVRAGWCKPFQRAQEFKNALRLQQQRLVSRPPLPRVEFTRPPAGRVWSRD